MTDQRRMELIDNLLGQKLSAEDQVDLARELSANLEFRERVNAEIALFQSFEGHGTTIDFNFSSIALTGQKPTPPTAPYRLPFWRSIVWASSLTRPHGEKGPVGTDADRSYIRQGRRSLAVLFIGTAVVLVVVYFIYAYFADK